MKHNFKGHLVFTAILALCGQITAAEVQTDPQEVVNALNMRQDIEAQLNTMKEWDENLLLQAKVKKALSSLLEDKSLPKRTLLSVLDFNEITMVPQKGFDQDKFGASLLKILKSSSPSLQKKSIEILLNLDGLKSSSIISNLNNLVVTIFLDASKDPEDQKYTTGLHSVALKSIPVDKLGSKQIKNMQELIEDSDSLSPSMRVALYQVVGKLFQVKNSSLTRTLKSDLSKVIADQLQNHPGILAVGASESEIEELEALLFSIQNIISDKEQDSLVTKLHPTLLKILALPNVNLVKASGDTLLALQKSENSTKVKTPISNIFLAQLSKTLKEASSTNHKAVYLAQSIGTLVTHFLTSEEKEEKTQITVLLKTLSPQCFHPAHDSLVRQAMLDPFFAIEPKHLNDKKLFDLEIKKILGSFFTLSINYLLDPKKVAAHQDFSQQLSTVLYEMSGKDFGLDGNQWGEWMRREGKDLFN